MKKIIITGVAGYVGSQLTEYFLKKKYVILGIDNFYNSDKKSINDLKKYSNFKFLKFNMLNKKIIHKIKNKYDILIHLAAQTSVDKSIHNPNETLEINIRSLSNALLLSDKLNCKLFIFTSSAAVYGNAKKLPIKENTILLPESSYGMSKKINEGQIKIFSKKTKTKFIILRLFNIYGQILRNVKNFGVISLWINSILKNKKLYIHNKGNCIRDFVHITDLIKIINKISKNYRKERQKVQIYNVGSSKKTKIIEVLKIIITYCKLYNFNFEKMEHLTRLVFSKKRKMIRTIFKKEGGSSFLNSISIDPNIRPENLTLEDFCKLEFTLREH